jgi:hypothetical protein
MKTKIKADKHGFYIRCDGKVYRPVPTQFSWGFTNWPSARNDGSTSFRVEEEVTVRPVSLSPMGKLSAARMGSHGLTAVTEYWHSHGSYMNAQGRPKMSHLCWEPKQ